MGLALTPSHLGYSTRMDTDLDGNPYTVFGFNASHLYSTGWMLFIIDLLAFVVGKSYTIIRAASNITNRAVTQVII